MIDMCADEWEIATLQFAIRNELNIVDAGRQ